MLATSTRMVSHNLAKLGKSPRRPHVPSLPPKQTITQTQESLIRSKLFFWQYPTFVQPNFEIVVLNSDSSSSNESQNILGHKNATHHPNQGHVQRCLPWTLHPERIIWIFLYMILEKLFDRLEVGKKMLNQIRQIVHLVANHILTKNRCFPVSLILYLFSSISSLFLERSDSRFWMKVPPPGKDFPSQEEFY